MLSSHIIGGEFDIDIQALHKLNSNNGSLDGVYKYSSGRSALYYILLDIKKRYGITTLYLPDYLCSSIIDAAEESQVEIVLYRINQDLEIDIDKFPLKENDKVAVLLINYFGLKDIRPQIELVRSISNNAIVIEDDVQAFYEFHKPDSLADYKFTSIRKTFACPDGGLVKTSKELPIITDTNKFHQFKLAGSILKSLRKPEYYDDEVYLHLFDIGENRINEEIAKGMSQISEEAIIKLDLERIAYTRLQNAKQILEGLKALNISTIIPIPKGKIPLFIPVWMKDRDKVRKRLFQQKIFCPVHWPLEGMNVQKGLEMSEHEMSIIIDQRYTNKDMDFILDSLEKALK